MKTELPEGMDIRLTEEGDAPYLLEWLSDPEIGGWFPMEGGQEIEGAATHWVGFHKYKCSWTATMHGVPCGIVTLYLQPYRRLTHQCEFGIVIGKGFRGMGVGRHLMEYLMEVARDQYKIELLHLSVFAENPAIKFYKRLGFREFGRQSTWYKSDDGYIGRVFMERFI